MYSFIIPVKDNFEYTLFTYNNIRKSYPTTEIVIVSKSTDKTDEYFSNLGDSNLIFKTHTLKTLSEAYNLAVSSSTTEKVVLVHNDMFIGEGFLEALDEDLELNTILTYTRVEPPIFNDTYPGKEIYDLGSNINDFNPSSFLSYCDEGPKEIVEGGSQLFFACYKQDYIGLDGDTFEVFCEDDDIHLRYRLGGFNMKVSTKARVYHFVSKTSRKQDLSAIEQRSNQNFIKKWGFRQGIQPLYGKRLILINPNPKLQEFLEPWFNNKNDIIVEVDGNNFTQEDFNAIAYLNTIIKDNGSTGEFKLGNLKVTVNSVNEYQNELIKL